MEDEDNNHAGGGLFMTVPWANSTKPDSFWKLLPIILFTFSSCIFLFSSTQFYLPWRCQSCLFLCSHYSNTSKRASLGRSAPFGSNGKWNLCRTLMCMNRRLSSVLTHCLKPLTSCTYWLFLSNYFSYNLFFFYILPFDKCGIEKACVPEPTDSCSKAPSIYYGGKHVLSDLTCMIKGDCVTCILLP